MLLGGRPRSDFAAPPARFGAAALDQLLEALEISAHATRVQAGGRAHHFGGTLSLIAHRNADQRPRRAGLLESDGAARLLPVLADPADLTVRVLLEDLRVPLVRLAGDG